MTISKAISTAYSGLAANARLAEIVARNVANASTEGYAARSLALSNRVFVDAGGGVKVDGPLRAGDPLLRAEGLRAEARAGADGALAGAQRALAGLLAPSDPDSALNAQFVRLENALRTFADTPESGPVQSALADAARAVTRTLGAISTEARRVRLEADGEIARQVAEVNTALSKIDQLNREIAAASASGRDATALADERDRLLGVVNSIVPIRSKTGDDGVTQVFSQGGAVLLDGRPQRLEFTPTAAIGDAMTMAGGQLSNVLLYGAEAAPTAPTNAAALRGGALEAAFRVRDEIVPQFAAQLDAVARDLILRFQSPAVDATLAPGEAGLFVDGPAGLPLDPGDPAQQVGLAGRIMLNAAVDPERGGALWRLRDGIAAPAPGPSADPRLAERMLAAFTAQRLPDGPVAPNPPNDPLDPTGFQVARDAPSLVAQLTALREGAAAQADRSAAFSRGAADTLAEANDRLTGVDTDAELQNLLAVEKAYAANARVLQVIDDLIRRILEI